MVQNITSRCIDQIFSNIPHFISNTRTVHNPFSDHSYITTTFTTKEQIYTPKFLTTKQHSKLTNTELKIMWKLNHNIKQMIHIKDPNNIAAHLQLKINTIIHTMAPTKTVKFKKDY